MKAAVSRSPVLFVSVVCPPNTSSHSNHGVVFERKRKHHDETHRKNSRVDIYKYEFIASVVKSVRTRSWWSDLPQ